MVINHPLSASCHLLRSTASSVQFTCLAVFFHNLSTFSWVYLLAWHSPLHTLYISSPSHFAVVPRLSSNPSLSLNPLLGTLPCSLTPHIHLTILISARWSATSFSFLFYLAKTEYDFSVTTNKISFHWLSWKCWWLWYIWLKSRLENLTVYFRFLKSNIT